MAFHPYISRLFPPWTNRKKSVTCRRSFSRHVATRVSVQLQMTDPDLKSRDRVVKKSEKDSLYAAMDVGCIWLERALAGK